VLGLFLPEVDDWLDVRVPLFVFSTQDAARSMLETIATATVSVAGISISVTIVAFTLSANQLSPRVLRSFRRDLLSQLTLAAFLGTFIYCLAVLVRLGSLGPDRVPKLSVAVAVVLAVLAFALFASFIGHIANMLQPASVIASIADDARSNLRSPYPAGVGAAPTDEAAARAATRERMSTAPTATLACERAGFLVTVGGGELIAWAREHDALIRQCAQIGDFVLPGRPVAEVWAADGRWEEEDGERILSQFSLGPQRTLPQDPGFPVRQLADVALKGLSPGINDPTTALNAMDAMTAGLIEFARGPRPCEVRVDADGVPRLLAARRDLAELVRLGFTQVAAFGGSDPTVMARLRYLADAIGEAAGHPGLWSEVSGPTP
jgi:uncharacterized membrane protein